MALEEEENNFFFKNEVQKNFLFFLRAIIAELMDADRSVGLALAQFVAIVVCSISLCHYVVSSFPCYVVMSFCCLAILSSYRSVRLLFNFRLMFVQLLSDVHLTFV